MTLSAGVALVIGGNVAFAGEVTGTGESLKQDDGTLHGASECAFSGLNDDPGAAFPEGGRTQSWGQLVSKLGPMGGVPGDACNPHKAGGE